MARLGSDRSAAPFARAASWWDAMLGIRRLMWTKPLLAFLMATSQRDAGGCCMRSTKRTCASAAAARQKERIESWVTLKNKPAILTGVSWNLWFDRMRD